MQYGLAVDGSSVEIFDFNKSFHLFNFGNIEITAQKERAYDLNRMNKLSESPISSRSLGINCKIPVSFSSRVRTIEFKLISLDKKCLSFFFTILHEKPNGELLSFSPLFFGKVPFLTSTMSKSCKKR